MELRTLHNFLAVVQEENISRAADVLHTTQPNLSRQMHSLEEELGVLLFERGKRLTLTDSGVMLKKRAEEVEQLMKKIESDFLTRKNLSGNISIGTGNFLSAQTLCTKIEEFKTLHPDVTFDFQSGNSDSVLEKIESGLLDFGLILEGANLEKFDFIQMKEKEKWGILIHKNNLLSSKKRITNKDLNSVQLITPSRTVIKKQIESWLKEDFSKLNIFATQNILASAVTFLNSGKTAALTLEGSAKPFVNDNFRFIPLYPELSNKTILVWKKFLPSSSVANIFLEKIKSLF